MGKKISLVGTPLPWNLFFHEILYSSERLTKLDGCVCICTNKICIWKDLKGVTSLTKVISKTTVRQVFVTHYSFMITFIWQTQLLFFLFGSLKKQASELPHKHDMKCLFYKFQTRNKAWNGYLLFWSQIMTDNMHLIVHPPMDFTRHNNLHRLLHEQNPSNIPFPHETENWRLTKMHWAQR